MLAWTEELIFRGTIYPNLPGKLRELFKRRGSHPEWAKSAGSLLIPFPEGCTARYMLQGGQHNYQ